VLVQHAVEGLVVDLANWQKRGGLTAGARADPGAPRRARALRTLSLLLHAYLTAGRAGAGPVLNEMTLSPSTSSRFTSGLMLSRGPVAPAVLGRVSVPMASRQVYRSSGQVASAWPIARAVWWLRDRARQLHGGLRRF
jgi:hypothetical protein